MGANSIALATKYLPLMDEVYKRESLTAGLDLANDRVKFDGSNAVKIYKLSTDGLGNYSRNNGFVNGGVTGSWETLTLSKDRGRAFQIDTMDNEETLGLTVPATLSEFIRTKVVPEIDAYRFARYASWSNISAAPAADITVGTTDVPSLIDAAEEKMNDDEVPVEGRILYTSEKAYNGLKAKITRYLANENGVNKEVEVYNGMIVKRVPKNRFNTAITLYDGSTSGQEDGGYIVPASTSYAINFMIIHPSAVVQVAKHVVPRIFTPEQNINADAYALQYRIYHDAWVLDNKVKGIYLHKASTANS